MIVTVTEGKLTFHKDTKAMEPELSKGRHLVCKLSEDRIYETLTRIAAGRSWIDTFRVSAAKVIDFDYMEIKTVEVIDMIDCMHHIDLYLVHNNLMTKDDLGCGE